MNVLLVGSGAREHALAWKLRQSPRLTDLFVAPGNVGTASIAQNLAIRAVDVEGVCAAAAEHRIDLVIVGPEQPLDNGLVDRLAVRGVAAFGPSAAAARIESSKQFAKGLMQRHNIDTAASASFDSRIAARDYVLGLSQPPVVKADGLAAGKGVIVCNSQEEALEAVDQMMGEGAIFGNSGRSVVIEKRMEGREISAHAFTDGVTVVPMPFSCDYKRIRDGDEGPNTGGMGAYSPVPWLDEETAYQIDRGITEATVKALMEEDAPYRGVLYPGLFITPDVSPRVVEFNCRFGDPEAQVLIPRLKSDLLDICWAVANNLLHEVAVEWSDEACVAVVLASGGYPDDYQTGLTISGLGSLEADALVFHAGTALNGDGDVVTAGGRVLTIVATGESLAKARAKAYRNVQRIHFSRCHYRQDIAAPAQNARVG